MLPLAHVPSFSSKEIVAIATCLVLSNTVFGRSFLSDILNPVKSNVSKVPPINAIEVKYWTKMHILNLCNGRMEKIYGDGIKYSGECKIAGDEFNGFYIIKHGVGTFTSLNQFTYSGQFKDNYAHGYGTFTSTDGVKFEGEFKNGLMDGQGNLTNSFETYQGHFKEGKKHGLGNYSFPDGEIFRGEFVNGKKHGSGIEIWPDGEQCEGQYDQNDRMGVFVCKDAMGKITYQGQNVMIHRLFVKISNLFKTIFSN